MSTFKNKNSLRTIEAQIMQKLKNSEARPKFTGPYQKACCLEQFEVSLRKRFCQSLVFTCAEKTSAETNAKATSLLIGRYTLFFFIRTNFIRTPGLRVAQKLRTN